MTTTDPTPLDLDAIADGDTGWDRDWIADLPGCLPSATYLKPDLAGHAQREIAALLADVDRLTAEVRRLRAERDMLAKAVVHPRRLVDATKLDTTATAPDVYRLPDPPPAEVTELWSWSGGRVERNTNRLGGWWYRGMVWSWAPLLRDAGPLSTTPPAGTEGDDAE